MWAIYPLSSQHDGNIDSEEREADRQGSGPASDGISVQTIKSHILMSHLAHDILSGGNIQNFCSEAGESHHRETRVHFNMSSKRDSAEETVA